jgi:XapX domain-containing protein
MSAELLSLLAGVLIGLLYALVKVRSPAPPAVALVGLLGMLVGEHLVTQMLTPPPTAAHHACQTPGQTAGLTAVCVGDNPS